MSEECPNPSRICPVDNKRLDDRLSNIENRFDEHLHDRLKYNEQIATALEKQGHELEALKALVNRVVIALEGSMGRTGVIGDQAMADNRLDDLERRINDMQTWRRSLMSYMMGVGTACSAIGTIVGAVVSWILLMVFGK